MNKSEFSQISNIIIYENRLDEVTNAANALFIQHNQATDKVSIVNTQSDD